MVGCTVYRLAIFSSRDILTSCTQNNLLLGLPVSPRNGEGIFDYRQPEFRA